MNEGSSSPGAKTQESYYSCRIHGSGSGEKKIFGEKESIFEQKSKRERLSRMEKRSQMEKKSRSSVEKAASEEGCRCWWRRKPTEMEFE
ncbi:hypothetical protein LXL04_000658 [Taraxacum kok-saghyz]